MQRLAPGYAESIAAALGHIPQGIRDRLRGVDFLCGVDPAFVGLTGCPPLAADGSAVLGVCYYGQLQSHLPAARRRTTIALDKRVLRNHEWVPVIAHELGHALDESIGFRREHPYGVAPVTKYADTNDHEAFAEAFALWVCGWRRLGSIGWKHHARYARPDAATAALFDRLSA